MGTAIGSIVSKLTLDTAQFNTKLQRSRRRAKKWGKDVARAAKVGGLAIAAAGTAAAVGLAAMVDKQLESIDASAKFARSIGIQTEKLAGLRLAGELNGVAQDNFDKSLQKMVRSIGDANTMGGTLNRVFDELGVSAEDLARKTPDEQLGVLADAFASVEDKSKAASLSSQIFGRQGVAMLNVLDLQARGLADVAAEAVAMGGTFTEIDARRIEDANDAITRMKFRFRGVAQEVTIAVAPYITSLTEQIGKMGAGGIDATDAVSGGLKFVGQSIAVVMDTVEVFKLAWKSLRAVAQANITIIAFAIEKLSDGLAVVLQGLDFDYETPKWLGEFVRESNAMTTQLEKDVKSSFNALANGLNGEKVNAFFKDLESGAERARQVAEEAAQQANEQAVAVEQAAEAYDMQRKNMGKVDETLAGLQAQLDGFGRDNIEQKLFDLGELDATNDQLAMARKTMEDIRSLEDKRDRNDSIADIVENLERQVRLFGVTDDQKTILELQALGAGDDIIAQAQALIDKRLGLEGGIADTAGRVYDSGPSLIRSGSAEAQAAAFRATQQLNSPELAESKKQTTVQERMAETLESIDTKTSTTLSGGSFEEVGIA